MSTLLPFLGACVVLALTPGPGLMFIAATGMAGGPRAGLAAALGTGAGAAVHVVLAVAGVAALLAAHPALFAALRWGGAAYLLWLAVQSWHAQPPVLHPQSGRWNSRRAFLHGTLTNVLNPKVMLFTLAFLPQFADPQAGGIWFQVLTLGAIMVTVVGVLDGAAGLISGHAGSRLAETAQGAGWLNRVAAAVYATLGLRLAIT